MNEIEPVRPSDSSATPLLEELIVSDPGVVPILFHEQKQMILKLLVTQEMTIIDIKKQTNLNPGTIKRHLDDLLEFGLISATREEIGPNSILMRFYRAKARSFLVKIRWPLPS
jgi:DNA-binding transcriptional ArsR family regulator